MFGLRWWVVIAVMTQAGFSGNNRYLVLGAALIEIAGGVGWGWAALELGRAPRPRSAGALARDAGAARGSRWRSRRSRFLFVPGFVGNSLIDIQRTHRALVYQAHLREDVNRASR